MTYLLYLSGFFFVLRTANSIAESRALLQDFRILFYSISLRFYENVKVSFNVMPDYFVGYHSLIIHPFKCILQNKTPSCHITDSLVLRRMRQVQCLTRTALKNINKNYTVQIYKSGSAVSLSMPHLRAVDSVRDKGNGINTG